MNTGNPLSIKSQTTESPRNSLDGCKQSRHEAQFYFADRFLIQSLARFFQNALEGGSSVIVLATAAHRQDLMEEMERSGVAVGAAIAQGRYVALDAAETLAEFMVESVPDRESFDSVMGEIISCSARMAPKSGAPVVIFGEMVSLLWTRRETQGALQLEKLWNHLGASHLLHVRCGYPVASFDREIQSAMFSGICGEHQVIVPEEGYDALAEEEGKLRTAASPPRDEKT